MPGLTYSLIRTGIIRIRCITKENSMRSSNILILALCFFTSDTFGSNRVILFDSSRTYFAPELNVLIFNDTPNRQEFSVSFGINGVDP